MNFLKLVEKNANSNNKIYHTSLIDNSASLTYKELIELSKKIIYFLNTQKIKKNSCILLMQNNSVESLVIYISIISSGYVAVPISNSMPTDDVKFLIKKCEIEIGFVNKKNQELKKNILVQNLDDLKNIIRNSKKAKILDTKDKIISLMFTSGSTGEPKGVKIHGSTLLNSLKNILNYLKNDAFENQIIFLPISHSFGLSQALYGLLTSRKIFLIDGLRSNKIFFNTYSNNQDFKSSSFSPSVINYFLNSKFKNLFRNVILGLKSIIVNSEKFNNEDIKEILKINPKINLYYYYGLTEASRTTFINFRKVKKNYFKSVGKPTSNKIKISIKNGEVLIKGNNLFKGYWKNNSNYLTSDGWFQTGDKGYLDKKGFLFLKGRINEQINIGGIKISTKKIESILLKNKNIKDAACIAIKDKMVSKRPAVAVVSNIDNLTVSEIENILIKKIDRYAMPSKIKILKKIPRSTTGKLIYTKLLKKFI